MKGPKAGKKKPPCPEDRGVRIIYLFKIRT